MKKRRIESQRRDDEKKGEEGEGRERVKGRERLIQRIEGKSQGMRNIERETRERKGEGM